MSDVKRVARAPTSTRSGSLPLQCVILAALFWLYHLALLHWLKASDGRLGAIGPDQVAPLDAEWERAWNWPWTLPALLVLSAFLWLLPRVFLETRVSPVPLLAVSLTLFFAIGLSVSMIDGYQERAGVRAPAVIMPYTRAPLEYFADVPAVERAGIRGFLAKYSKPRLFDRLSLHTRTHPPGGVLFHWLVSRVFGYGLWPAALATIAFTALTVPLLYFLAREAYGERVARVALALLLVTPNFVMFTVTSMDGPFSVFPLLSVWLVRRALRAPRRWVPPALLAGVAMALAVFMTYAAVFGGLYMALLAALGARAGETRWRRATAALAVTGGTAVGCHLLLALGTGLDLVSAIPASMAHDRAMMGTGHESVGRYLNISVANLAAFLVFLGIPQAVAWLREVMRGVGPALRGRLFDPFVAAGATTILMMACSTLFTLEVERVWLFMVPFVVVVAAVHLDRAREDRRRGEIRTVILLMCLQLFGFELMLRT